MAKEILVRKASVEDAEAIVGIFNPIIEAGVYTVFDTPFTVEAEREYILNLPHRGILHVAVYQLPHAQTSREANSIPTYEGEFTGQAEPPAEPLTLWYRRPARQWVEALPVGNGRLGAMIYGGIVNERLQLNEDTLYGGGPYDPNNPESLAALPEVRRLVFEGRYSDAHKLIGARMMARPLRQMPYQTAGDFLLTFPEAKAAASG